MQAHELELMIGDTVWIGDRELTVIDIDGGEVTFRVDSGDEELIFRDGRISRGRDLPPR
jgi:hypothetical protein